MMTTNKQVQLEIAQRFIKSYHLLCAEREVRTKKEFCEKVHLWQQNFSIIEQGKMYCTLEHIYYLTSHYGVSLNWLIKGEGDFKCQL